MNRHLAVTAALAVCATRAAASVPYDFNDLQQGAQLPLSAGGFYFSSANPSYGYTVGTPADVGANPTGFTGNCLIPNTANPDDLIIESLPLTYFSIQFAPQEVACTDTARMRITTYRNDGAGSYTLVGTATAYAPVPGTWPQGRLTFSGGLYFDRIVIHYDVPPTQGGTFAPTFIVDNIASTVYFDNPPSQSTWYGTTSTWSTNSNWDNDYLPSTGMFASFIGNGSTTVNVDAPQSVGKLQFSTSNYTLTGSAISLDNTGSSGNAAISCSSGTQTVNTQIVTTSVSNLDINVGGGVLNLAGGINNSAGKTITIDATGGAVMLGAGTNSGPLVIAGGNVYVSGAITGTGVTTLNGGKLGGRGSLKAVLAGTNAHTIAPSVTLASSATATLTVASLITNTNTTLQFKLIDTSAFDRLKVQGNLNISQGVVINVVDNNAPQGYYSVITYGSLTAGSITINQPASANVVYILDSHFEPKMITIHKTLIADGNGDGIVDGGDFDIWFTHLQVSTFAYEDGDYNNDGIVDGGDFDLWFTHLQNVFGSFTDTQLARLSTFLPPDQLAALGPPVPEPATLSLLVGASLLFMKRRPRYIQR